MRIIDAASYIIYLASIDKNYSLTPLKLQKILYYAQGFSYVWNKAPLFDEEFEAWQYGPVNREVYYKYKKYGQIELPSIEGKIINASTEKIETLEAIWENFKSYDAFELVKMTHKEDPWINSSLNEEIIENDSIERYFIRAYS